MTSQESRRKGVEDILMASQEPSSGDQRWSLKGMTALVTGGTKGIGLINVYGTLNQIDFIVLKVIWVSKSAYFRYAIVEELAGFGAAVHMCSRNQKELKERLPEWEGKGYKVSGSVCDLLSREQREGLIKTVSSAFGGKLNLLVPYPSLLVCKQSDNSWQSLPTHSIRPTIKERCVSIFIDMAKDTETSKPKHLDPTSEYYLSSQANSGNSLTKDTLKGDNYVAWEQSAILTLKSHNKIAFIDGRITKPDPESEDFLAWDITYQFLMGLDDKYATLRTQIINMDPFPNIDRVYAMVMQEESHRGITGSRDTTSVVGFHAQNGPPTARSSGLVSATAGDPDRTPTGRP
ncbi:hypothetical protein RJ639_031923 [Escallonia herrerae]|uniref:Retrotransposon Copia-like N-terminal domain-containing protein n=1 Tax=Escallonia herrerae TaxID=1293975 RepID=A0AA88X2G6_9ASTE|nr:hypothetical protein RJ639_031923 [Escallonia herrerae]